MRLFIALGTTLILFCSAVVRAQTLQFALVHEFQHEVGGGDGAIPGRLTLGADGMLYGTTVQGGRFGGGTVFQVKSDGTVTIIHSFKGVDGIQPSKCLIAGSDGGLYGAVGEFSHSVFRLEPLGDFKVVYQFPLVDSETSPEQLAVVVKGIDGHAYAVSASQFPMEFAMVAHRAFAERWPDFQIGSKQLYARSDGGFWKDPPQEKSNFDAMAGGRPESRPMCGDFMAGPDGHVWGAAESNVLRTVSSDPGDGKYLVVPSWIKAGGKPRLNPEWQNMHSASTGSLVYDPDGNFYALNQWEENGKWRHGIIRITPDGKVLQLATIEPTDASPFGFFHARDGYFYALEMTHGAAGANGLLRFKPGESVQHFSPFSGTDKTVEFGGPLVQGNDGSFYGTTINGGQKRQGTVFRLTFVER